MPAISLVVCLYQQDSLLKRLLESAVDCYDDLVVIHDGPADSDLRIIVGTFGGDLIERDRQYTHEAHWPFAWAHCAHDWILLLDADELLSLELAEWIRTFRVAEPDDEKVAGFTCIWPLWNGTKEVTSKWPAGRIFLIDRRKIRYFGMGENRPSPVGHFQPLPLILRHQPTRKSYGLSNILFRRQAYRWRGKIAEDLSGNPTDLPCWKWTDPEWPPVWREIRVRPLRTALKRLLGWPLRTAKAMKETEGRIMLSPVLFSGVYHCLIALAYWWRRRSLVKR